jgi:hypothetical protein
VQDLRTANHAIETVEVQARDAVIQEPAAEGGADLHSQPAYRFVVVRKPLQLPAQAVTQLRPAQGGETSDLLGAEEREDAGDEWHHDAAVVAEVVLNGE